MTSTAPASPWRLRLVKLLWRSLRSRLARRLWVVALYLGLLGGGGAAVYVKTRPAHVPLVFGVCLAVALLAILIWQLLTWWARPGRRRDGTTESASIAYGVISHPDLPLDERETAVRDSAYRRAYQLVFLAVLAASVAAYILEDQLPGLLRGLAERDLILLVFFGQVLLLASLPVAFQAWTEPDEQTLDESDLEPAPAAES